MTKLPYYPLVPVSYVEIPELEITVAKYSHWLHKNKQRAEQFNLEVGVEVDDLLKVLNSKFTKLLSLQRKKDSQKRERTQERATLEDALEQHFEDYEDLKEEEITISLKEMYRFICSITHPDKTKNEELTHLYTKASKAYRDKARYMLLLIFEECLKIQNGSKAKKNMKAFLQEKAGELFGRIKQIQDSEEYAHQEEYLNSSEEDKKLLIRQYRTSVRNSIKDIDAKIREIEFPSRKSKVFELFEIHSSILGGFGV